MLLQIKQSFRYFFLQLGKAYFSDRYFFYIKVSIFFFNSMSSNNKKFNLAAVSAPDLAAISAPHLAAVSAPKPAASSAPDSVAFEMSNDKNSFDKSINEFSLPDYDKNLILQSGALRGLQCNRTKLQNCTKIYNIKLYMLLNP